MGESHGAASPILVRIAMKLLWLVLGLVRGYRLTMAGSMVPAEYYRKQVELLIVWAMATTNPDLKAKLVARALEFLALVDCADDGLLRGFQELFAEFNAQLLQKP